MSTSIFNRGLIRDGILTALAAFIAFYTGNAIAAEDYMHIIMPLGVLFLIFLWFFTGSSYWIYVVASSFLAGSFPILGGTTAFVLLMWLGIAKYLFERVIFVTIPLKRGPQPDFFFICCFIGVMTLHAIHDRLGLKVLGSDVWGGRFYVLTYVSLAGYFIINSVKLNDREWQKLPLLILGVYLFDGMLGILTAMVPSLVNVIGQFYTGVSLTNYVDEANGFTGDESGRVGAVGQFGYALLLLIFARYRISSLWQPHYVLACFGTLLGVAGVFMGGYRSTVIEAGLLFFAIGLRDLKERVVLLVLIAAGVLLFIPVINSAVPLPLPIQRAVTFLPGMKDTEMGIDAQNSNEFRYTIWTTWYDRYFPEHWAFGRGFGFNPAYGSDEAVADTMHNPLWDIQFIETGNLHNGLISSIDGLGVFGAFFFIAWNVVVFARVCVYLFREDRAYSNIALRYVALYLFVSILTYWWGALNLGTYLVNQLIIVGVFNTLLANQRERFAPARGPTEPQRMKWLKRLAPPAPRGGVVVAARSP